MNPRALAASERLDRLREIPDAVEALLRGTLREHIARGETRSLLARATAATLERFDDAAQCAGLPSAERMRRRTDICAMLAGFAGSRLARRLASLPRRAIRCGDGLPVDLLVNGREGLFGVRFTLGSEPLGPARLARDAFRRYPAMRGLLVHDLAHRRTRHLRNALSEAA